jgi:hypothetical protein
MSLGHATRVRPDEADRVSLAVLDDDERPVRLIARTGDGCEIELPVALGQMVRAIVHDLLGGNTVLALSLETRFTPNEAAELCSVSPAPFCSS